MKIVWINNLILTHILGFKSNCTLTNGIIVNYDREAIDVAEKKTPTKNSKKRSNIFKAGDEAVKRIEFLRKKLETNRISEIKHAKEIGKIIAENN